MERITGAIILLTFLAMCPSYSSSSAKTKTVVWDRGTLVQIHHGSAYSRIMRLLNKEILCSFEDAGKAWVVRSRDNGRTWSEPIMAAQAPSGTASNPEMLQLANGQVLMFYNERPNDGIHHFTIQVTVSKDNGVTWRHLSEIYEADTQFHNGCWEPAAILLLTGEIQVYFANENPYRNSDEQEITLRRSHNGGRTWSAPETVSFRAGHRDGMPVPLILQNNKGIVVAIEDNGYSLLFHPVIIHTTMQDNWHQSFAGGGSPRRWRAVKAPINKEWGGAPYIRQMPGGETILSFQSSVGREKPQMVVYVGDENAKNFGGRSVPFDASSETGGWWNSLFVKDDRTITAISSCNGGIWAIDGHIKSAPAAD